MIFLIRNLRNFNLFEVYASFYKKHIRPQIANVVSYMHDTTAKRGVYHSSETKKALAEFGMDANLST